jgi:hypothetical protein
MPLYHDPETFPVFLCCQSALPLAQAITDLFSIMVINLTCYRTLYKWNPMGQAEHP